MKLLESHDYFLTVDAFPLSFPSLSGILESYFNALSFHNRKCRKCYRSKRRGICQTRGFQEPRQPEKKSWTSIRFTVKLPELGLRPELPWHELPWVTSHAHRTSQDYCKANEIKLSLWWKTVRWSAHAGLQHVHPDSCPSSAAALGLAMAWQRQGAWENL